MFPVLAEVLLNIPNWDVLAMGLLMLLLIDELTMELESNDPKIFLVFDGIVNVLLAIVAVVVVAWRNFPTLFACTELLKFKSPKLLLLLVTTEQIFAESELNMGLFAIVLAVVSFAAKLEAEVVKGGAIVRDRINVFCGVPAIKLVSALLEKLFSVLDTVFVEFPKLNLTLGVELTGNDARNIIGGLASLLLLPLDVASSLNTLAVEDELSVSNSVVVRAGFAAMASFVLNSVATSFDSLPFLEMLAVEENPNENLLALVPNVNFWILLLEASVKVDSGLCCSQQTHLIRPTSFLAIHTSHSHFDTVCWAVSNLKPESIAADIVVLEIVCFDLIVRIDVVDVASTVVGEENIQLVVHFELGVVVNIGSETVGIIIVLTDDSF
uniref:Uncharacterized protein n=1 Tax=Glossina brevipalpis TaxID=37001 RepID=A0A1A9W1C9_9MUSC